MTARMRLLLPPALALLALAPTVARADDPTGIPSAVSVSGSVGLATQYRFRGLSRSDGQPAAMADLDLSLASGWYGGISAASLQPGPAIDLGHGEIDVYGGWDHALGSGGTMLDLGLRGYFYADHARADLIELSAALHRQIGPIDLRAGWAWAPPQGALRRASDGSLRANTYLYAQTRLDWPGTPLHLHAHLGHTAGGLDYTGAYTDYRLGVGADHRALGLDLSLVGTTVSHAAAIATAPAGSDPAAIWRAARSAGVVTLSLHF